MTAVRGSGLRPEATELTREQRAAVDTPGSLVVRAGAGSGKTAVLVARYVRLICGDVRAAPLGVAQVLAVTFTEKAAAEMRTRIREALAVRSMAATGEERARLVRTQRALASARIGTIHALAASLLRRAPLESATRPGAVVLDEIDGPAWTARSVQRFLLERLRAGDDDVRVCADAWGFGSEQHASGLVAVVCDLLAILARRGVTVAALAPALARQVVAAAACTDELRGAAARITTLVEGWLADPAPHGTRLTPAATAALAEFRAGWPEWRAHLRALANAPRADVGPEAVRTREHLVALRAFYDAAAPAFRRRTSWRECQELLTFRLEAGTPRFEGTLAAAVGCVASLPLATAFTRVLEATHAELARVKRREGVLTFDDLIAGARDLLADPRNVTRLAGDVRAILVDEFQDTDPAQVDLLRRLAGDHAELFVVGDEKQSIYRFRGAEVQLFAEMRAAVDREVSLADNFRSRPPLLAFVNGLAARLFAAGPEEAPWRVRWSASQRLRPQRGDAAGPDALGDTTAAAAIASRRRPLVRVMSLVEQIGAHGRELPVAAARALEARVIAATITDLVAEGWRPGDIAVLLPALTQVKAYEFALRRWRIPYAVVRGRGFYECQEIRDLVQLLAAVVDDEDGIALAGALRSPLFGLSDATLAALADHPGGLPARFRGTESFGDDPDAEAAGAARDLLRELRALRDRVSAGDLLTHAVAATHLEAVLLAQFHGAQRVANVRKLIAQARAERGGGFVGAREFAARARRLLDLEPREPEAPQGATGDVVQVMTIHQAKGLEFSVVIVADLGREPMHDYRPPAVLDREYGVLAFATIGAGRHRLPHRLVEAWRRDDHARADAERARLFYVACTRARDVLVLSEGKGRRAALAAGAADDADRTWCEQLWSFLGRDAITAFIASGAPRVVLEAPGEAADGTPLPVAVEIAASAALLAQVSPPERDTADATFDEEPSAADARAVARICDAPALHPGALAVSPTALADFASCPRQFWYRHMRGIGEDGSGGPDDVSTKSAGPTRAAHLGMAAHTALEALEMDVPASARLAAVAAAVAGARDLDDTERDAVTHDLVAALARHAAEADALQIHGREVPFCLRIEGPPEVFIRGRIDVVAERRGHVVIRDYKYARPHEDGERYRVQLETYALAVAAAFPGRPLDAEIDWLRAPGGRATLAIDVAAASARITAITRRLAAAIDERAAAAFPLAFSAPAPCRALGCPFVARCFPSQPRARGAVTANSGVAAPDPA